MAKKRSANPVNPNKTGQMDKWAKQQVTVKTTAQIQAERKLRERVRKLKTQGPLAHPFLGGSRKK